MVKQTMWTDRRFIFGIQAGVFPCILERLRGTPARLDELAGRFSALLRTSRLGHRWTIQQHIGHLLDLEELSFIRLDNFLTGSEVLSAADMANRKTEDARHNEKAIGLILAAFSRERHSLVGQLATLDEQTIIQTSLHPRLRIPMSIVDWSYFMAEHDDHHIARITALAADSDMMPAPPAS